MTEQGERRVIRLLEEQTALLRAICAAVGGQVEPEAPKRESFAASVESIRVNRSRPRVPEARGEDNLPPSGGTDPAEFWRRKS